MTLLNDTEVFSTTRRSEPVCKHPPYRWDYAFSVYLYLGAYFPTAIIGILLNIVTIIVFNKMGVASYRSIIILAWFDLLYVITVFIMYPFRIMILITIFGYSPIFGYDDWYFGHELIIWTLPLFFAFQMSRNWAVVIVNLERLFVVMSPLYYKRFWGKKQLIGVTVFIFIFSVFCNWPFFFPLTLPGPATWPCLYHGPGPRVFTMGAFGAKTIRTIFDYSAGWAGRFTGFTYLYMMVIVPLFSLIIVNIVLLSFILRHRLAKRRQMLSADGVSKDSRSQSTHEAKILKMVLSIVLVFFVCEIPAGLDRLFYFVWRSFGITVNISGDHSMVMRKVGILLSCVDSSLNFIIYCATNDIFRKAGSKLFRLHYFG
ncbi:uncharacterized protein LOC141899008 [Tubulanus polymorphus]|uniref:uncharacterized protein LOC141899008 n=1 Tax=Tubulanus polymorphus TaxID=672921 RepID=UPI003DA40283